MLSYVKSEKPPFGSKARNALECLRSKRCDTVAMTDQSDEVTAESIAAFRRDGYFLASSLLDAREVEMHRDAVDRAVAFRTRNDGRALE